MITQLDARELARWQEEGVPYRLLDVRSLEEKALADLGGQLIPLPELEARWKEIAAGEGPLVCYCHHGVRSLYACSFLRSVGIEALNLRGGVDAWSMVVDPDLPRY